MFAKYKQQLTQKLFHLVQRLIFSRWARNYQEYHTAHEDVYAAQFGPLHLETNQCIVLEHDDAFVSLQPKTPWGVLHLWYGVCLGEEQIRPPGFYCHLWRPAPSKPTSTSFDADGDFPF
jgi:hypothetical protein